MSATAVAERTDEQLIAAFKAGEIPALGELYQRYYRQFRKYAHKRGGQESDDILQVTFLKLMEQPELIRDTIDEFKRLVYIIMDSRTKNVFRDKKVRASKEVSYDSSSNEDKTREMHEELVADAETRLLETERYRHNQGVIHEVILGLPFKHQQIIGDYLDGMTMKEAGTKYGVSKQRAEQVIKAFREKLAGRVDFQLAEV